MLHESQKSASSRVGVSVKLEKINVAEESAKKRSLKGGKKHLKYLSMQTYYGFRAIWYDYSSASSSLKFFIGITDNCDEIIERKFIRVQSLWTIKSREIKNKVKMWWIAWSYFPVYVSLGSSGYSETPRCLSLSTVWESY